MKISIRRIINLLSNIIVILTLLSILSQIYKFMFNNSQDRFITDMFNLDNEYNFPTLYASLTLFFCSFLLLLINSVKKEIKFSKHWFVLGIIFLLIATDEILVLHEQLSGPINSILKTNKILTFSWVIPGIIFLIIFIISYIKFLIDLPTKYRNLFIFSGAIYVFGAVGMEIIGSQIFSNYGSQNLFYALITNLEEVLEMLGVLLFIFTLLSYIKDYISNINIIVTD